MAQQLNTAAGMHAAAGAARLHAGAGMCAYPWHVGTTRSFTPTNVVITDSKLRHRWPQEPSP